MNPLIRIEDLKIEFRTEAGRFRAVDGVSLVIHAGETIGLVGESGSGKTVTALSIMRLMDPRAEVVGGQIWFKEEDLLRKSEVEMRGVRGRRIAMVFQEPMTSLNPSYTIGEQVAEVFRYQFHTSRSDAKRRALEVFERVKLPSARAVYTKYPHELSGGMRQRVMIAAALACKPDILIADEPTTALDVSIQAQILALLREIQSALGMAVLFISHNLEVVAELCKRVAVIYGGRLVEIGSVDALFQSPAHPYTEGLLRSIPQRGKPLKPIAGAIFDPQTPPLGCRFHPRCPHAQDRCSVEAPELQPLREGGALSSPRTVSCHYPLIH